MLRLALVGMLAAHGAMLLPSYVSAPEAHRPAANALEDSCTSSYAHYVHKPFQLPTWELACTGACEGEEECKATTGVSGSVQIQYCACAGGADDDACCHLIVEKLGESFVPRTKGPCGGEDCAPGRCTLVFNSASVVSAKCKEEEKKKPEQGDPLPQPPEDPIRTR